MPEMSLFILQGLLVPVWADRHLSVREMPRFPSHRDNPMTRRAVATIILLCLFPELVLATAHPLFPICDSTTVRLPFGISLTLPATWTSTTPGVLQALTKRCPVVDASGLQLQEDGSLVALGP